MKAKIIVTFLLAISFGISGMIESNATFQQLWFGIMVMNLGMIYKWVFELNLKGRKLADFRNVSNINRYQEQARN